MVNNQQFPLDRPIVDKPKVTRSPVPAKVTKKPIEMDFFEAIKQTLDGKKITRLSWETNSTYGQMVKDELMIFVRGEFHSWTIVPGDITANDWIILPD